MLYRNRCCRSVHLRRLIFAATLLTGLLRAVPAQQERLIPFKIEDQFKREYSHEDFLGTDTVVIGSDSEGSRYSGPWKKALREALETDGKTESVQIFEVADVRGVPFFLKGMVRGKFPREKENRVLLDWKGVFAETYGFEAEACTIVIFDRTGIKVYQSGVADVEPHKLDVLLGTLRALPR